VCDAARNCTTSTVQVGIDTAGPVLTISGVADGGKYPLGTALTPTCAAADAGAGLTGDCTLAVAGGNNNGVGAFTLTATAVDLVGRRSTTIVHYAIVYSWAGFLQPINDPTHQGGTGISVFKAGSAVPVKFSLLDASDHVIQPVSAPVWLTPIKGTASTLPVDEDIYTLPTDSGSAYRFTDGKWQYNWKTDPQQAGFHWRIGVRVDDGETHYIDLVLR
jgi:hypothetical protein